MRATSAVLALAAATGTLAQIPAGVTSALGKLSPGCQQTVLSMALGSELSQCLHVNELVPVIMSAISPNASFVPVMDKITSIECGQSGCSNATLISAAQQIGVGCATDLQQYNITNGTLRTIMAQYPLAREVVCLQTRTPFNGTNAPIPLTNPPYNITNGTAYCTTSLLTQLSAKVGQNISVPLFMDLYSSYQNGTLGNYAKLFNATDLCNDCIFGAADLIGVAYPGVGNVTLSSVGLKNVTINSVSVSNVTIAQALNTTCAAQGYAWTYNGTLPSTVRLGAYNSTTSFNITAGAITTVGKNSTTPIRRNVANIKARWIGEQ